MMGQHGQESTDHPEDQKQIRRAFDLLDYLNDRKREHETNSKPRVETPGEDKPILIDSFLP
jgi:hypothetical protein